MVNFNGISYDLKDPEQKRAYHSAYHRIWREANKDRLNAYQQQYRKQHPEKRNMYQKTYQSKITDEQKQQRREKNTLYARQRYQTDAEFRERKASKCVERYRNDETYRLRVNQVSREYYAKKKQAAQRISP